MTLLCIFTVTTSGTIGGEKNGRAVVAGSVALSKPKNDSAATGANSL